MKKTAMHCCCAKGKNEMKQLHLEGQDILRGVPNGLWKKAHMSSLWSSGDGSLSGQKVHRDRVLGVAAQKSKVTDFSQEVPPFQSFQRIEILPGPLQSGVDYRSIPPLRELWVDQICSRSGKGKWFQNSVECREAFERLE